MVQSPIPPARVYPDFLRGTGSFHDCTAVIVNIVRRARKSGARVAAVRDVYVYTYMLDYTTATIR